MNTIESPREHHRPGFSFPLQMALGLWSLVSPFVVGYAVSAALWNTVLAGAAMLILSLLRAGIPQGPILWFLNLLPGVWLIAAPFLFDYLTSGAFWNSIITGVVAVLFSARSRGAVPGADPH